MNDRVKNFIKYETARVSGRWNMITEAVVVAEHLKMPIETYRNIQLHYSELHAEAESFRAKSKENEAEYTACFEIEYALRQPAPF